MTTSGVWALSAANAAGLLVNGKTSCPSLRSNSATIWTMVSSSSTRTTRAIATRLVENRGNEQAGMGAAKTNKKPTKTKEEIAAREHKVHKKTKTGGDGHK